MSIIRFDNVDVIFSRDPREALKLLDKQADEIFKSGGSKPSLNAALRQLAELRQRKALLEQECADILRNFFRELRKKRKEIRKLEKSRVEEQS